jgi:hypothetical protein
MAAMLEVLKCAPSNHVVDLHLPLLQHVGWNKVHGCACIFLFSCWSRFHRHAPFPHWATKLECSASAKTVVNLTPAIADPEFQSFVAFLCRDDWEFMAILTGGEPKGSVKVPHF